MDSGHEADFAPNRRRTRDHLHQRLHLSADITFITWPSICILVSPWKLRFALHLHHAAGITAEETRRLERKWRNFPRSAAAAGILRASDIRPVFNVRRCLKVAALDDHGDVSLHKFYFVNHIHYLQIPSLEISSRLSKERRIDALNNRHMSRSIHSAHNPRWKRYLGTERDVTEWAESRIRWRRFNLVPSERQLRRRSLFKEFTL